MEQVMKDAYLAYPEELSLFDKAVQNVGVKDTRCIEFQPVNDYTNQALIEFSIPSNSACYIDLKKTLLSIRCKVTKDDGTKIKGEVAENVCVVNNFFNSMMSRCDLALQDRVMTSSDQTYPYRAYLDNLLYTGKQQKETTLKTELYYSEVGEHMQHYNYKADANEGIKERGQLFKDSNEVDLIGPIHVDITQSLDRYLLPGVSIKIKLYPATPEFCLLSPDDSPKYKVVVTRASLRVCYIEVVPEISIAHSEILKSGADAIYPFINTQVKKFTLPSGIFSHEITDMFQGKIPSEIVLGLVAESAQHGSYVSNPFYFENAGLNFLQVTVDGRDLCPGTLHPKYNDTWTTSHFVEAYNTLRGIDNATGEIPVSKKDYYKGYCLYRFYTENIDGTDNDTLPLKRTGNLRISMNFDKKLPYPMTLVVYAKFPSAFKIDSSRSVYHV